MTQNTNQSQQPRVDFGNVDQSTYPHLFVRYLQDTRDDQDLQIIKQQSFQLMGASAGKHVLDVGCGIGDDVRAPCPDRWFPGEGRWRRQ
ncbi:MAG TPA: hypothetical protein VFB12_16365 [Ktedonobacteraceae bacterium]|nr:hypothetical protein [Ktedonobacteraceae bacterium]